MVNNKGDETMNTIDTRNCNPKDVITALKMIIAEHPEQKFVLEALDGKRVVLGANGLEPYEEVEEKKTKKPEKVHEPGWISNRELKRQRGREKALARQNKKN